jgi:hypothetical protein
MYHQKLLLWAMASHDDDVCAKCARVRDPPQALLNSRNILEDPHYDNGAKETLCQNCIHMAKVVTLFKKDKKNNRSDTPHL